MQRTLKLLSTLIIEDHLNLSLEEISTAYKGSLNPSLLAVAFKKTYNLIIDLSNRYYGLTNEDIASYALEKLDDCLLNFNSGQAKFTTYYTTVLKNKFREETEALNTHKRKALFHSNSYEVMVENGYDPSIEEELESDIITVLHSYQLTQNELAYCKLIVDDFSNAEIAAKLDVSVVTLSNMRKKLRQKLPQMAFGF